MRGYRLSTSDRVYDTTMSAGVYTLEPGDTPDKAFRRADAALYEAKARGKNTFELWRPGGLAHLAEGRTWSPQLKNALDEGRVEIHLQPIVSLADEQIVFHEALCRIRRVDGGQFEPAAFINHAERLGLTPALDCRVLDLTAQLLAQDEHLKIFVNFSTSSFDNHELLEHLHQVLETLPAGRLGIEITEHTSLSDFNRATTELTALKALGSLIAIDDFGVGFSSFSQLAAIPSDLIKIDGRFAADDSNNPADSAIARAITNVAHAYGKHVVIEGIETAHAAQTALEIGIEYAQGWYYGKPVPVSPAARIRFEESPLPARSGVRRTGVPECG